MLRLNKKFENFAKILYPEEEEEMKKIIGLLTVALVILVSISAAEAKPYKPLSMGGDYTVDISDDALTPDLSRFKMAGTKYDQDADGSILMINYYQDPSHVYLLADDEETFPYIEIIKWEMHREKNVAQLVFVVFINGKNEREIYVDKDALTNKPATGRLEKFTPAPQEFVLQERIRKMLRK